jgi:hypothetical protein
MVLTIYLNSEMRYFERKTTDVATTDETIVSYGLS